jgi:glutamate-1-semialdehyde 2,1-aminomutase
LLPPCIARAQGPRITDVDGNEYIDCHMAYTANVLGHRPLPVLEAVRASLDLGLGTGHSFEAQVELAELVKKMVPDVERVALFHTGGDAVLAAVRMARAATGRRLVAKFEGCYHGWHEVGLYNPTMLLSGRAPAGPLDRIAACAATGGVSQSAAQELVVLPYNSHVAFDLIRDRAADLACVVADPVPPFMADWLDDARAFMARLQQVTTENDVPLVLDEVVSGFRLAPGGAKEALELRPEMSCYGKITSGLGIALSMVAGRARQLDTARSDGLLSDYSASKAWVTNTHAAAHPAIVASLAQLRFVEENHEAITARLDRNHALLARELDEFAHATGIAVRLHGHPRLQSMVVLGDHATDTTSRDYRAVAAKASRAELIALLALTLYLRLEGVFTKTVPSMNLSAAHTDEDVELVAEALKRSLLRMRNAGVLPD